MLIMLVIYTIQAEDRECKEKKFMRSIRLHHGQHAAKFKLRFQRKEGFALGVEGRGRDLLKSFSRSSPEVGKSENLGDNVEWISRVVLSI